VSLEPQTKFHAWNSGCRLQESTRYATMNIRGIALRWLQNGLQFGCNKGIIWESLNGFIGHRLSKTPQIAKPREEITRLQNFSL